jgi:hypothetical protein
MREGSLQGNVIVRLEDGIILSAQVRLLTTAVLSMWATFMSGQLRRGVHAVRWTLDLILAMFTL